MTNESEELTQERISMARYVKSGNQITEPSIGSASMKNISSQMIDSQDSLH